MDINSILFQDEQLLWSGKGTPQRSLKTIRRYLLIFGFVLLFLGLAIYYGVTTEDSTIIFGIIVALLFCALCGYGFVYQIIIKPKKVVQKEYYLTNQRAIIYDTITYEYCYGFLMSFSEFRIDNYANGYGDVYMGKILQEQPQTVQEGLGVAKMIVSKDKTDMPCISFESIQNPASIMQMVKDAKNKLNTFEQ